MEPIKLDFEFTDKLLQNGLRLDLKNRYSYKKIFIWFLLLALIYFAISMASMYFVIGNALNWVDVQTVAADFLIDALAYALVVVVVISIIAFFKINRIRKQYAKHFGHYTGVMTSSELEVNGPNISSKTKWDFYEKILEGNDIFLLYTSPTLCQYLPRSAFNTENDIASFKKIITMHSNIRFIQL